MKMNRIQELTRDLLLAGTIDFHEAHAIVAAMMLLSEQSTGSDAAISYGYEALLTAAGMVQNPDL